MMREIIFRGKRIDNGKLDYGYLYKEGSQSFILKSGRHYPDVIYGPTPLGILDWCEVIPETVGQFTGLTDKNGNKIFEGDIIEYPPQRKKFIAEFHNDCFGARDKKDKRTRIGSGDDFIIIGNIHDNQELAEVKYNGTI